MPARGARGALGSPWDDGEPVGTTTSNRDALSIRPVADPTGPGRHVPAEPFFGSPSAAIPMSPRRRRTVLATIAAAGLAGCLDPDTNTDPDPDAGDESASDSPTETDTPEPDRERVDERTPEATLETHRERYAFEHPARDDIHWRYTTQDERLEFRVGRVEYGPFEYLTDDDAVVETEAEHGQLVAIITVAEYTGRDEYELAAAPYPVYADGEWYWPRAELPSGASFEALQGPGPVFPTAPDYGGRYTAHDEPIGGTGQLLFDLPDVDSLYVDISPEVPEAERPVFLGV